MKSEILSVLTVNVFAVFLPETSIPSIAKVKAVFEARPTTLTLDPALKPAPPAKASILLIIPEKTSETIASASFVAPPPVIVTISPTL